MNAKTLRSATSTHGRKMAGARALWRATGFSSEDFGKPIVAISNSFTQFVPGHVHLHGVGQKIKKMIEAYGAKGVEFNTIAVDDGIAMGHDGMLYSLPSRDLIADSVEYMVNAHCADALICISNCDKITPGMMMAAMRLNVPTIFVSGGPMEAGKFGEKKVDLVDAMVAAGDENISDEDLLSLEVDACPTCGSCSGMFTANSMNCLAEALGIALPGNGTLLATHRRRAELFEAAAKRIVELAQEHYFQGLPNRLPREIVTFKALENAMSLDIAMGGSTNTVLHILAIAHEAGVNFSMKDIDTISRRVPTLSKVAPSSDYHIEDVHRAGGIMAILEELEKAGLLHPDCATVSGTSIGEQIKAMSVRSADPSTEVQEFFRAAPGGMRTVIPYSQNNHYDTLDIDSAQGCIRSFEHAHSADGGLCVLYGNIAEQGCIVKTAGVDSNILVFSGPARIFHSQNDACDAILGNAIAPGDVVLIRYEGPKGGPGMQEMLYPTSYIKAKGLGKDCALITDGRFSGGTSGLSIGHISPEAAEGGAIALVEEGDIIEIDIPKRLIQVRLDQAVLAQRREAMESKGGAAWHPGERPRKVSLALQTYARLCTSAARGAVRDLSQID